MTLNKLGIQTSQFTEYSEENIVEDIKKSLQDLFSAVIRRKTDPDKLTFAYLGYLQLIDNLLRMIEDGFIREPDRKDKGNFIKSCTDIIDTLEYLTNPDSYPNEPLDYTLFLNTKNLSLSRTESKGSIQIDSFLELLSVLNQRLSLTAQNKPINNWDYAIKPFITRIFGITFITPLLSTFNLSSISMKSFYFESVNTSLKKLYILMERFGTLKDTFGYESVEELLKAEPNNFDVSKWGVQHGNIGIKGKEF
jgi:hypothetical protein